MPARIVINGRTSYVDRELVQELRGRRGKILRKPVTVTMNPVYVTDDFGNIVKKDTFETRVPGELPLRKFRMPVGFDDNGKPILGELSYSLVEEQPTGIGRSPALEGRPVLDPHEGIVYTRVAKQDPSEGWATTDFWQDRYKCDHATVLELVRTGLMQASVRMGSQIRRYRVVNDRMVRQSALIQGKAVLDEPVQVQRQPARVQLGESSPTPVRSPSYRRGRG